MEVDGWMDGVDSSHFFGQKKRRRWEKRIGLLLMYLLEMCEGEGFPGWRGRVSKVPVVNADSGRVFM